MNIKTYKRRISLEEYQSIRKTTGWNMLEDHIVQKALKNDLFSISIYDDQKLVGIGRVIGDGYIYFYIQDIIVIPEYQKKGIGMMIMDHIEEFLSTNSHHNSFVGLMAARNVSQFYEKYGYKDRPANGPGMFKVIVKPMSNES